MESHSSCLEGVGKGLIDRIVMGKMKIGIDLLEGIKELAQKEAIQSGVILSGIGALKKAIFRNAKVMPADYKMEDQYRIYLEVESPLELVSLPGWIARKADGEIEVHAHFSASTVMGDKVVTLGGHLTPGTITSIKVVVIVGVIENTNIGAALDPRINQIDLKL